MTHATTLYLDWNVVASWADTEPTSPDFTRLWKLVRDGKIIVVFTREHIREATVGWTSSLLNQRRAIRRLCVLDALSRTLGANEKEGQLHLSLNTPFEVLTTVLADLDGDSVAMAVMAKAGALVRDAHNQAIETIHKDAPVDLSSYLIEEDEHFSDMGTLAFESIFRLTEALLKASRSAVLDPAPRELNNLNAEQILGAMRNWFKMSSQEIDDDADIYDLLALGDQFWPGELAIRPRVAQANAMLNSIGYHRDSKRTGGRSIVMDGLHLEQASYCGAFVTADKKLYHRYQMVCELLGLMTEAVLLPDLPSWLTRFEGEPEEE